MTEIQNNGLVSIVQLVNLLDCALPREVPVVCFDHLYFEHLILCPRHGKAI